MWRDEKRSGRDEVYTHLHIHTHARVHMRTHTFPSKIKFWAVLVFQVELVMFSSFTDLDGLASVIICFRQHYDSLNSRIFYPWLFSFRKEDWSWISDLSLFCNHRQAQLSSGRYFSFLVGRWFSNTSEHKSNLRSILKSNLRSILKWRISFNRSEMVPWNLHFLQI